MVTAISRQSALSGAAGSRGKGGGEVNGGGIDTKPKATVTSAGVGVVGGDPKDPGSHVVARHVADFGNVVLGFTKTKAFRVANTGKVGTEGFKGNSYLFCLLWIAGITLRRCWRRRIPVKRWFTGSNMSVKFISLESQVQACRANFVYTISKGGDSSQTGAAVLRSQLSSRVSRKRSLARVVSFSLTAQPRLPHTKILLSKHRAGARVQYCLGKKKGNSTQVCGMYGAVRCGSVWVGGMS